MRKAFQSYHPSVNFMFFTGAIGMGMFINHPVFVVISWICSVFFCLVINRRKAKKIILSSLILCFAIAFFNGIMNPIGNTVLFVWLNNRNFTMEALFYGAVIGANFASIMIWFSCYNIVMTNDKFMYLFSKFAQSTTLILSMILRLVPNLEKKTKTIINARNCIGKTSYRGSIKDKIHSSMEVLSILTSCALEDAVITADSMRSRGYVSKGRTNYTIYSKTLRDKVVKSIFIVLALLVFPCIINGGISVKYMPEIIFPKADIFTIIAVISYFIFLFIPTAIEIVEEITWHILKSKI